MGNEDTFLETNRDGRKGGKEEDPLFWKDFRSLELFLLLSISSCQ